MSRNYPETIPAEFADPDLAEEYRQGWNHGHGIACHNVPKIGDKIDPNSRLGRVVNALNVREYHEFLCHAAADNSRCYSPFEITASRINSLGEFIADEHWEAFEAGTADAIAADLAEYTDEDYGLED